jgi:hypothetical protein
MTEPAPDHIHPASGEHDVEQIRAAATIFAAFGIPPALVGHPDDYALRTEFVSSCLCDECLPWNRFAGTLAVRDDDGEIHVYRQPYRIQVRRIPPRTGLSRAVLGTGCARIRLTVTEHRPVGTRTRYYTWPEDGPSPATFGNGGYAEPRPHRLDPAIPARIEIRDEVASIFAQNAVMTGPTTQEAMQEIIRGALNSVNTRWDGVAGSPTSMDANTSTIVARDRPRPDGAEEWGAVLLELRETARRMGRTMIGGGSTASWTHTVEIPMGPESGRAETYTLTVTRNADTVTVSADRNLGVLWSTDPFTPLGGPPVTRRRSIVARPQRSAVDPAIAVGIMGSPLLAGGYLDVGAENPSPSPWLYGVGHQEPHAASDRFASRVRLDAESVAAMRRFVITNPA